MPDLSQVSQEKENCITVLCDKDQVYTHRDFRLFFRGLKSSQKTKSAGLQSPNIAPSTIYPSPQKPKRT